MIRRLAIFLAGIITAIVIISGFSAPANAGVCGGWKSVHSNAKTFKIQGDDELVTYAVGSMSAQKRDCNGGMTEVSDVYFRLDPPFGKRIQCKNVWREVTVNPSKIGNYNLKAKTVSCNRYGMFISWNIPNQIIWSGDRYLDLNAKFNIIAASDKTYYNVCGLRV